MTSTRQSVTAAFADPLTEQVEREGNLMEEDFAAAEWVGEEGGLKSNQSSTARFRH